MNVSVYATTAVAFILISLGISNTDITAIGDISQESCTVRYNV